MMLLLFGEELIVYIITMLFIVYINVDHMIKYGLYICIQFAKVKIVYSDKYGLWEEIMVYESKNGLQDAKWVFGKLFSFENGFHNTNYLWFV